MRYMVLMYDDGRYVAVDSASGGYPYPTDRLDMAKIWAEPFFSEMKKYIKTCELHVKPVEVIDACKLEVIINEEMNKGR